MGDPVVSSAISRPEIPGYQLQASAAHSSVEERKQRVQPRYRQTEVTKRGGTGGRKSQHPHSTVEAGEVIPVATLWRKGKTARGCLVVSPSGGNMAKTPSFEPVST